MKNVYLLGIILFLITSFAKAQNSHNLSFCGFDEWQSRLRKTDPDFQKKLILADKAISAQAHKSQNLRTSDVVYTLPLVVHVIHTGGSIGSSFNPSDQNIMDMIALLNQAWRKNGGSFGGVDTGIQFQLATQSPNCTSTTGINRIDASGIQNYTSGGITNYPAGNPNSVPELTIKSLSRWSNTAYINIWIVNKINGDANAGGYTYFPQLNSALLDGITIAAGVVNGTNKTIVHEMGHAFSLYHPFEDGAYSTTCPSNADCTTQGDQVCDTEPVKFVTGCPNPTLTNECTGNPYAIADATYSYTVLNNHMGYTSCPFMFTQGQKDRIRGSLLVFKSGLLTSGGLNTSISNVPKSACSFTATNGLSQVYGVQRVIFNSLNVYSNTSNADGSNYVDRTCEQQTILTQGQTYILTVVGSYHNPHKMKAYLDFNNNGNFSDAGEEILSATLDSALVNVFIPLTTAIIVNKGLRLRVVADNPVPTDPTSCHIEGETMHNAGQAEDYTVIIKPREIQSVQTGNWNAASTWSCNCVPTLADNVTVKTPHQVTSMPTNVSENAFARQFTVEKGAVFKGTGVFSSKIIN